MEDILARLANSSSNESSHELQCRCFDAAEEISGLRDVLNDLLCGDVGKKTLDTLATGQGTDTNDGRAWIRAAAMLTPNNK